MLVKIKILVLFQRLQDKGFVGIHCDKILKHLPVIMNLFTFSYFNEIKLKNNLSY